MTRGLLVSAPRSGSGKTVVALGLMRALARRGLAVAAAKNGPDYIDPAFHAAATGRTSRNLDTWAMAPALVHALAAQAADAADVLVCEGAMGLFDGVAAPPRRTGASADLAALLGLPVLLVLDVSGQAQTAAAVALGCARLDPQVEVAGVVLNRVASPRHETLVREAMRAHGFSVVGALPRNEALVLPERHLGLVQAGELPALAATLEAIADFVAAHVDLDAILELAKPPRHFGTAQQEQALFADRPRHTGSGSPLRSARNDEARAPAPLSIPPPGQRIAVARDAAFSFLYPHLLDGWRAAGTEITFFSPLADEAPAQGADCCWLPGGYPELHAGRLAAAGRFKRGLRAFAETRPVHGECGGYMVLGGALIDKDGNAHEMTGLLGLTTSFAKRKLHLGYREGMLVDDGPLGRRGTRLRGHEFHYASVVEETDPPFALLRDAQGAPPVPAGGRRGNATGSFFHAIATEA